MVKTKVSRPKILIVGHIPPPQEGTAKLTYVIISSEYLKRGFQIEFVSLFKRKGVTHRGKFGLKNIAYNLANISNYVFTLAKLRPHLVYMSLAQNQLGFIRDSMLILIGKIFRRKICVHFHGGSFGAFYETQSKILKEYIKFALSRIDSLVLLAEKFQGQFINFVDVEKINFLHNCAPVNYKGLSMNKDYLFKKRRPKVVFVGYLSKAKGALDLVKAAVQILVKHKRKVEFVLCGQPVDIERNIIFIAKPHLGYSKILSLIRRNNIGDHIKIMPEVLGEEKEKIFRQADIFVLPSYSEGCALVVLEAMAFGLPIITTPVGALEEMIEEKKNCLFVEPGDSEGISEKILFLLNNPDICRVMGEANRKLVESKYNSDIFLHKLSDIWMGAL